MKLTDDGEKLVDYARQMLQLEAAAFASVSHKALAGRVRLGIPDDYAESFLPGILTRFIRRHPLVEVSVICESSLQLHERVTARDLDLAIVTECADLKGAEILREGRCAGPWARTRASTRRAPCRSPCQARPVPGDAMRSPHSMPPASPGGRRWSPPARPPSALSSRPASP